MIIYIRHIILNERQVLLNPIGIMVSRNVLINAFACEHYVNICFY